MLSRRFSSTNYSFACSKREIVSIRQSGYDKNPSLLPHIVIPLLRLCCSLRGGEQQEDLGGGSGAAITSLGTLVFEKTATFKDTVDVSCDPRCD